jgi:hypothetical protein
MIAQIVLFFVVWVVSALLTMIFFPSWLAWLIGLFAAIAAFGGVKLVFNIGR